MIYLGKEKVMYALFHESKLVGLTDDPTRAADAVSRGCATTLEKIDTLEELAIMMEQKKEGCCQASAAKKGTLASEVWNFLQEFRTELEEAGSKLMDEAKKVNDTSVAKSAKSALSKARKAGSDALDEFRSFVHKATKKKDCCGGGKNGCETVDPNKPY